MMNHRRNSQSMRQFYDWFHRFYGLVERNLGETLAQALSIVDPHATRFRHDSFLELACGSANLGLLMAPRVDRYAGRAAFGILRYASWII